MKFGIEQSNIKENSKKTFEAYFSEGIYKGVDIADIPKNAVEYFEQKSKQFVSPETGKRGNLRDFFVIDLNNDEKCFGVMQEKTYGTNEDTEELIYIYEVNINGNHIGNGEIRNAVSNQSEYFKNKPFVGFTRTEKDFAKQGYGRRRLMIMNALSQLHFDYPLNSDTIIFEYAENIWEKLVEEGIAVKYMEGGEDRYKFIK